MIGTFYYEKLKLKNFCQKEKLLHEQNYYLDIISFFDNYLELNGNVFYSFFNQCINNHTLEYIFILRTLFKNVVIINSNYVYCFQYLGNKLKNYKLKFPLEIEFKNKEVIQKKLIEKLIHIQKKIEKLIINFDLIKKVICTITKQKSTHYFIKIPKEIKCLIFFRAIQKTN